MPNKKIQLDLTPTVKKNMFSELLLQHYFVTLTL